MKKAPKKFYKTPHRSPKANFERQAKKVKKTATKKKFFPKNFRSITERLKKAAFWKSVFIVICLGILVILIMDVTKLYQRYGKQHAQRLAITQQINSWQKIVAKYPDYRDGYFKLALLENQLGNKNEALIYLQKALVIDPNFEEGRELEKLLISN